MSHNESYTIEEMARLLKVSKLTVYDLIKKGEIQAFRVGRQMRIDAKELEQYKARKVEGHRKTTASLTKQPTTSPRPIVISGQDNCLDSLARQLESKSSHYRPLRSYVGSLDSLIAMYHGHADIVSTHLFDGDTLEYNIPYIRKLFVSKSFLVIKFISRQAGLYVAKGNPKNIHTWTDLKKPSITIINREGGAGARVLLDEQLRIHRIQKEKIRGYTNEESNHLAIASAVANGRADVGVGIEQTAKLANVDFIPLITESYDLVMLKTTENKELVSSILEILQLDRFKEELQSLGHETNGIGEVIYEQ